MLRKHTPSHATEPAPYRICRLANDSLGMWSRIRAGVGQEAPHWIASAREDPKCEETERVVYEGA